MGLKGRGQRGQRGHVLKVNVRGLGGQRKRYLLSMYPYPSIVGIQLDRKKECLLFYSMLLKNQVSIYFMESIFGDAYLSVEMNICEKSMTQPLL